MKHGICVIVVGVVCLGFGWTSRGDYVFSKMFAETVQVACGKELK